VLDRGREETRVSLFVKHDFNQLFRIDSFFLSLLFLFFSPSPGREQSRMGRKEIANLSDPLNCCFTLPGNTSDLAGWRMNVLH